MCVFNVCVCVCARMSLSILHLSLFHHNAAASTLTPQHTLSRQSVCRRIKEMECACVKAMNKGGRRWSQEKPEEEERSQETENGKENEIDRKGGPRGQIWEKAEWDIWKRERVTGTRRKLQLPNNDSLGKILLCISLSSLQFSNLST